MSNQKRIGILCFKSQETGHISIQSPYASYFSYFGTVVPIFALDDHINHDIDLLVLPGGADVAPSRYTAKPNFETQNPNVQLEYFDTNILPQYIDAEIPIFGICRGFQTLNIHFGGKLSQHIVQTSSTLSRQELSNSLAATEAGLEYNKGLQIYEVQKNKTILFKVNSMHHQGVFGNDLGKDIIPLLVNNDDKNIEAFTVVHKPIFAVQWHPEEIRDRFSNMTIRHLLKLSKRNG